LVNWKQNLAVIWLSQFISIMGFNFALPFAPYFIQELGVTDPVRLKLWVAVFAAATPLSLAVFSPIWGMLADRYGRRLMLLRANFAGAIVLALMGTVHSVQALVFLRILQGVFTGTMTAAQTMVSVNTPNHRSGFALGTLTAAMFSGAMSGAFVGGLFADWFGFRGTFFAGGLLLLLSGLLVAFGTTENFVRHIPEIEDEEPAVHPRWTDLGPALPILFLIMAMAIARQFDQAMLPLLVQEIHGTIDGVSVWTGSLSAVGGIAGLLAALILGRLADRVAPPRIGKWCALGAGVLVMPQGLAHGFLLLFASRFGMIFCAGGLDPVFQIWLSKVTPEHKRGAVFGWAATARSIGWVIAPLVSGLVASGMGVRSVFFVGGLLFFCLVPVISAVVKRLGRADA
jgi:MFS transporter, DHA1 family, multidrug resistance protein